MNRVVNVARLQLLSWFNALALPWLIMALSFAINMIIAGLIDEDEPMGTGGLATIYIFVFIAYLVAMREYFPFAMGLSVSRRIFFAATSALAVAQALAFSVVLVLLSLVEAATGGWGVNLALFNVGTLQDTNPALLLFIYAVPMALVSFLGMFIGGVSKRWGANGLYTLAVIGIAVIGAAVALVTWLDRWITIGRWFVSQSPTELAVAWPALITIVLAAGSFLVIRRATT